MNTDNIIPINSKEELYSLLPSELKYDYTIGFHGFDGINSSKYWIKTADGSYKLNENEIQASKERKLSQGLRIRDNRYLLSTSKFNDLEEYISTAGIYLAGGIIIALPKIIRNQSGEEIFIGGPNEKSINNDSDRNHIITSLSELVLPENNLLNPTYILGTYSKQDNKIFVSLNPKHLAFNNNGIVSDEFFNAIKSKISLMEATGVIPSSVVAETSRQKEEYFAIKNQLSLKQIGRNSYNYFGTTIGLRLKNFFKKLRNFKLKRKEKPKEPNEPEINE